MTMQRTAGIIAAELAGVDAAAMVQQAAARTAKTDDLPTIGAALAGLQAKAQALRQELQDAECLEAAEAAARAQALREQRQAEERAAYRAAVSKAASDWLGWLDSLARLEREAAELWRQHAELGKRAYDLGRQGQAMGLDLPELGVLGRLDETGVTIRRGGGYLQWRPLARKGY